MNVIAFLLVITELTGLSAHRSTAGNALAIITNLLSNHSNNLRIRSLAGSYFNSILPLTENWNGLTPDDVVLEIAKQLKAILITQDVNLRLKARMSGSELTGVCDMGWIKFIQRKHYRGS